MKLEIQMSGIEALVAKQLMNIFYFDEKYEGEALKSSIQKALKRCENCFSLTKKRSKYYVKNGDVYFNPFHSGQYSIFLYYLSNTIFNEFPEARTLADRLYYLNKTLNGLDLFYEIEMPVAFFLDHPVGTVLGRGIYGKYFSFSQGCTVGNNKGVYPTLGKNVKMMSGSKILGKCIVGDDVIISANAYIKDEDIPSCSIVFGSTPNLIIKRKDRLYFE